MAVAPLPSIDQDRKIVVSIGPIIYLRSVADDLRQILESGEYEYQHIELSKGDRVSSIEEFSNAGIPVPDQLISNNYLYDYDETFAKAAYVFSSRFHGFVMAILHEVPHVVPILNTWKLKTFVNHDDLEALALGNIQMIREAL